MTTLDQAAAQMLAAGMPPFPPGHPVVRHAITRYGPGKKAWYRLYENRLDNGVYVITGAYGIWGELDKCLIEVDWKGINQEERQRLEQARAEAEVRERAKIAQRATFAANRARVQWHGARAAPPANVATYLNRKGVEVEKGLRFDADGTLLVPMLRYDISEDAEKAPDYQGPWRLAGLQKIAPDGAKRFNKGMAKDGTAFRLGKAPARGELILVCEGVATGLSLRMATKREHPVFVAFDAGNLAAVGRTLRALFPASPMLFCADDDAYLVASMNKLLRSKYGIADTLAPPITGFPVKGRDGQLEVSAEWSEDKNGVAGIVGAANSGERTFTFVRENTGRAKAQATADAVGNASVIFPVFADRVVSADPDALSPRLTDFNDLHQAQSLAAVAEQLQGEIARWTFSREVAKAVRREVAQIKKETKSSRAEVPPSFDFDSFLQRFVLIYPSDTVYDSKLEIITLLRFVKVHFGEAVVKWWLASPLRRTVTVDQVVFDPEGKHDAATHVNLFRGLAPPPAGKEGESCQRLLALLEYLCGEEDLNETPITDWVLNWLAYPIQHVGAKMATALVMHGPSEGTGKNLFFNAVRDIYRRYGSLITQTQLESDYNDWMSQRLFVIANEVISRQELRHHVGRLKNMITESPLPIEAKFMAMRYEDNHLNMVFLTNELHGLQISPTDRRYMVIRTPGVKPEDYYQAVLKELATGGGAALHRFLLDRDLGDFNAHTKPLVTEAKEAMIEMGLNSPQQFWRELHDGLLYPLEYGPALWLDLFPVYQAWCYRNGVKNPRQSNYFGQEFMTMNGVQRLTLRIADPDKPGEAALPSSQRPQRSVYLMGDLEPGADRDKLIEDGIKRFRRGAREYMGDQPLRKRASSDGEREGGSGYQ